MQDGRKTSDAAKRHRSVAVSLIVVAGVMLGASFAAVPLYRLFCQVTGYGGTIQQASQPADKVLQKRITIRFDANTSPGLRWTFQPAVSKMDVRIGETSLAFYRAKNDSSKAVTGTAIFNVTPEIAGAYFNKLECFCFTEQTLKPGQVVDMPVSFFIDPAIVKDVDARELSEITLSYTFYPSQPAKPKSAAEVKPVEKSLSAKRTKG